MHTIQAALMAGQSASAITTKQRKKAIKALKSALWLRVKAEETGKDKSNRKEQARIHYQLFRLLSSNRAVDEAGILAGGGMKSKGVGLLLEAMSHVC